jgi:hypothetical protein
MKAAIATVIIFVWVAGCSGGTGSGDQSSNRGFIGGDYAQCDGQSPGTSDNSPEVTATINTLVPSSATVNCTGKQAFQLTGQTISMVIVPYGQTNDCPSGCFSSEVCSIVDGPDTFLYSAVWYSGGERPLSIPPDCPELGGAEGGDTIRGCTNQQPPGLSHPVTQTAEFQGFQQSQSSNGGKFRFCFF